MERNHWTTGLSANFSEAAQFALISALKDAQKLKTLEIGMFKRHLKGKYRQRRIWELWFDCGDKREYRLLGIFGPERKQVTFLIGCYHKGRNYTPDDALDSAFKRAGDLTDGKATTYERKIPTDR